MRSTFPYPNQHHNSIAVTASPKTLDWLMLLPAAFLLAACCAAGVPPTRVNPLAELAIYDTRCDYVSLLADWECSGKVRNDSAVVLRLVTIRVTVKDAGREIGTQAAYIDSDRLAPGASSSWTVYISDPDAPSRGKPQIQAIIDGGVAE